MQPGPTFPSGEFLVASRRPSIGMKSFAGTLPFKTDICHPLKVLEEKHLHRRNVMSHRFLSLISLFSLL